MHTLLSEGEGPIASPWNGCTEALHITLLQVVMRWLYCSAQIPVRPSSTAMLAAKTLVL